MDAQQAKPVTRFYHRRIETAEFWESNFEFFRFLTVFIDGVERTTGFLTTIDTDWYNAQLIFMADFYHERVMAIETDLTVWAGEEVSFGQGWDEELLTQIENNCQLFRLNDGVRRLMTTYVTRIPELYTTCKDFPPDRESCIETPELDASA